MEFLPGERVIVNPLRIRRDVLNEFESSLVISFTGQSRRSDTIIKGQVSGLAAPQPRNDRAMHALKRDATEMKVALSVGDIQAGSRKSSATRGPQRRRTAARDLQRQSGRNVRSRDEGRSVGRKSVGRRRRRVSDADDRSGKPISPDQCAQRRREGRQAL